MAALDLNKIRASFPILEREVNGKKLVYFDNAASSQKPVEVINAIDEYYKRYHSNVHRGVHTLSQEATIAFEEARKKVARFINAKKTEEIVFTSGTTESINLVAQTFGRKFLNEGDEVLISYLEHHSNIVPWQMIAEERGAKVKVIPINKKGELILDQLDELISDKTKIVAVNHVSNSLGTINPIKSIIDKAHQAGAKVLIDGAQAIPHMKVDVQDLDADFYVFSGHKMFAPTGTGILYGKEELLDAMPPWKGGGEMIKTVTFEKTTYNDLPHKFEAGTPDIEGAIALGAAIDYLEKIGMENIADYENELLKYAELKMREIDGIEFYGTADNKASVISFLIKGAHPFDVGTIIDKLGVAVRTGHHCTEPLMDFFDIPGTVRASFAFYNTKEEIDIFIEAVKRAARMLA